MDTKYVVSWALMITKLTFLQINIHSAMDRKKIFRCLIAALSIALLVGCATDGAIPRGYSGDVVTVIDNVKNVSPTNAHFFELISVDGRSIETSSFKTRELSFKIGFRMAAAPSAREIPLSAQKLLIGGFHYRAIDLFGFGDNFYQIRGAIDVHLERGKSYLINGELAKDYAIMWLEEDKTGLIVSEIIVDGAVSQDDLSRIKDERAALYNQSQAEARRRAAEEGLLLVKAKDYFNNAECMGKADSEHSAAEVYLMAEALFKNKEYRKSLACFEAIADVKGAPQKTSHYLYLIYDVGLGVEENGKKAALWRARYERSEQAASPGP